LSGASGQQTVYSDIGPILIGDLLEHLGGDRLDGIRTGTLLSTIPCGFNRAFGWDKPRADGPSGSRFSIAAYGHTGFTGTSLWIDPKLDLYVILLTNRVHPDRRGPRLSAAATQTARHCHRSFVDLRHATKARLMRPTATLSP
jgi:CubicO group peptidase (beta-lactamase class C family)